MQAQTLTPAAIFGSHVRYVVPLFQRPYVWTEGDQWQPLWDDVQAVAEQALQLGPLAQPAPHFLGAIVVDQPRVPTGYISTRHVVDGQQRLTTLQLLLDAAREVTETHGRPMDANGLRVLVRNDPAVAQHDYEVFKVWPTDRDRTAFREAMAGGTGLTHIEAARSFFVKAVGSWARTPDPEETARRLEVLSQVLHSSLKAVVIDLEDGDNAQVIFETLNHRGSPLLAADLIKNLIFQTVEADGRDVERLYRDYWSDLDNTYWRQKVARGRQYVPRVDIFVNHWLVMRLQREVQTDRIFADFRDYLLRPGVQRPDLEQLLRELAVDARTFAAMDALPATSPAGRFRYRVLQAMDSAVVTPFLLWLLRWPPDRLPAHQRDKALAVMESWMVRRGLCRLTTKETNRLVVDLIKALSAGAVEAAGDITERFLIGQKSNSRFWPPDTMVIEALKTAEVYKVMLRPRLRMLLEAAEDVLRNGLSEGIACPRDLTIEHIMPIAWREHWGQDLTDEVSRGRRDKLVQTIGNLTLVTRKLNPTMSNRPWTRKQTAARGLTGGGKRDALLEHSVLKLNADLVTRYPDAWTEAAIRERGRVLTELLLRVWPRPASADAPFTLAEAEKDRELAAVDGDTTRGGVGSVGKYQALADWLHGQLGELPPTSFEEVEDILGFQLPMTARTSSPYWHDAKTALGRAIRAAGYKATGVLLADEKVTFVRMP